MRKLTTSIAALSAAVLTVGLAGPAHAELYGLDDPRDTTHGSDLIAVSIRNGDKNLVVKTHHFDLQANPASGSGGAVFIDTDPSDKGPELVFVGGYFEGTDYTLLHTEGFGIKKWGEPVEEGTYILKADYAQDTVRMKMSRAAIGNADDVRVAIRVSGTRADGTSDGLTDWLGQPRWFTPWIAQG